MRADGNDDKMLLKFSSVSLEAAKLVFKSFV